MTHQALRVRSTDGVRLTLWPMGGSGPDLLICHATGFHGHAYAPLAESLLPWFRVWVMDFHGHGSSQPSPTNDYGWDSMGRDVAACAEAIDTDRLYGFGHSMGGAALLGAEEEHPGTFTGLFLYEPVVAHSGFFTGPAVNSLAEAARQRREVFASRAAALTRYASRPPLNSLRSDCLFAYVEAGFTDLSDGRVRLTCRAETEALTFGGRRSCHTGLHRRHRGGCNCGEWSRAQRHMAPIPLRSSFGGAPTPRPVSALRISGSSGPSGSAGPRSHRCSPGIARRAIAAHRYSVAAHRY